MRSSRSSPSKPAATPPTAACPPPPPTPLTLRATVRRYVNIDTADVQFNLQSDDRLTLYTASFPLRAMATGSSRDGITSVGLTMPMGDMAA